VRFMHVSKQSALVLILFAVCAMGSAAGAPECDSETLCPLPVSPDDLVQHHSMLSYIEEAHAFLADKEITKSRSMEDILFCVLEDGNLVIVRATRKEKYIPLSRTTMEIVASKTDGYLVERVGGGGKNTRYRIEHNHVSLPLLAVKRFDGNAPALYTPHSDAICTNDVVRAGDAYLSALIQRAFDELIAARVPSRAFTGAYVGETQRSRQERIVKAILLNEHMGPGMFQWLDADMLIERVMAIFGANKECAYSHSKSPAAARGIGQFISSTYERVVREYPSAGLIPSFVAGTENHLNSVKAMICLIDTELDALNPKVKERFAVDPKAVEIFIPSFYNGGSSRTQNLIDVLGDSWDKPLNTSSDSIGKGIKEETIIFLKKFKEIIRYLDSQ